MTDQELIKKLERPAGPVDVVIDTDTFNEIDDQYALAYLIKSGEKLRLRAIYAAPFHNEKSKGPGDGMEKSYQEIMNILDLMEREDLKENVYKGAVKYLPDESQPVESAASEDLIKRAMERKEENPLYIIAIGAITNIASAIMLEPEIINRVVVVWLGGNSYDWHDNREFNLYQDVAAARVVFDSGVPLVQLPCMGVVSHFATTGPELKYWLSGKNKLCDYLVDVTSAEADRYEESACWSRAIWDVAAVAWLLDESFMLDRYEHSPVPEYDDRYAFDRTRHLIKYVYAINRDRLLEDLFHKLTESKTPL